MPRMKYFLEGLPPQIVKRAEMELGETEEVRTQALKELKRLIKEEPDFFPLMDDVFLLRFLRTRKFNLEKSFKNLKSYYVFKARYSGLLSDLTVEDIRPLLEANLGVMLEYRDDRDVGAGLLRMGLVDLDKRTPDQVLGAIITASEIGMTPEVTSVVGYNMILDFKGLTLAKAKKYASPAFLYRFLSSIQDCMPCRIKGYHIINEPYYFSLVLNMARPFVSEKLNKRFWCHGNNLKSLHQHIPPEILPNEFGGTAGPFIELSTTYANTHILTKKSDDHLKRVNNYGYRGQTLKKLQKESKGLFF